jgi:hypothetical protein
MICLYSHLFRSNLKNGLARKDAKSNRESKKIYKYYTHFFAISRQTKLSLSLCNSPHSFCFRDTSTLSCTKINSIMRGSPPATNFAKCDTYHFIIFKYSLSFSLSLSLFSLSFSSLSLSLSFSLSICLTSCKT